MIPALSQVCTLHSAFDKDIEDYAAGRCAAIEIWLTKLETYLTSHSLDDVRRLLDQNGVTATAASFQGGLLDSQGDARREHWDHFARRLELCQQLSISTLVVACDVAHPHGKRDLERVRASLSLLANSGQQHEVKIAMEFQAAAAVGNNLHTMAALVSETRNPFLGINFDAFHYYVGPSKSEDLGLLDSGLVFHVQLCDLADVPREYATDADRILPGDGDLPLDKIASSLRAIDYQHAVSVELMNPHIWQIPPRQFGEIGITALRKVLGL